jgi:hypothetical protein
VTVESVAAIERYAAAGETPETIVRALRSEKHPGDEVAVADVIAELRKG